MPFTFSHPAAALPFHYAFKKRLSVTALIAGSLVPDFEYFIRLNHLSFYSHTWAGLFWLDLPVSLLLCFVFHKFLRGPLYENAPLLLKKRMAQVRRLNWAHYFRKNWLVVLVSLLLGAASHLVWDKITHHSVRLIESSNRFRSHVPLEMRDLTYFLFWDMNSVVGALLLLYAFWLMPVARNTKANKGTTFYWLLLTGSAGLAFLFLLTCIQLLILDNIVIAVIDGILAGLLLASAGYKLKSRAQKTKGGTFTTLREKH